MSVVLGYLVNQQVGQAIARAVNNFTQNGRDVTLKGYVTIPGAVLDVRVRNLAHHVEVIAYREDGNKVSEHLLERPHPDVFISDRLKPNQDSLLTPRDLLEVLTRVI